MQPSDLRYRNLQEKSLQKILSLSQKLSAIQKKSSTTAQELESKERQFEQKIKHLETELRDKTGKLQTRVDGLLAEKQTTQKAYDDQIRMLTEHIVELSQKGGGIEF